MAYNWFGCMYCDSLHDFRKAVEFFQQGLAIAKEVRDKEEERIAHRNLGISGALAREARLRSTMGK